MAFYRSKVLNAMMIVVIVSLLLMMCTQSMVLPVLCGSVALLFFIGYSLWLWIKKPGSIVINDRLSDINGLYTLYILIIVAINPTDKWWFIIPIVCAVFILFLELVNSKDEKFDI